ncbi:MAG: TIGR01212 family radical SAM protein [Bacteroidales bacterium]|nr:TIGR01212 family radical SAM protein [Bacteroidales bacterium]
MKGKTTYPWGTERRFHAYPDYFRRLFGGRVQKVSVDAGLTCPNRDGKKGTGGCIFCNNDAFNPSYCQPSLPIKQQITEGIRFHRFRYRRAGKYLAYFQTYSNTYAPLPRLKKLYEEALSCEGVIGLIISTRPDCVDTSVLDYLASLSEKYYVAIEYGIESVRDETLQRINRMHTFSEAEKALELTRKRNLPAGAHFIVGLPGENNETILEDIRIIADLPLDTVKFHQLQIFENTKLAEDYRKNAYPIYLPSLEEYLNLMVQLAERLNPYIVIERIASEVPPRFLVNPGWGAIRYDEIQRRFEQLLEEKQTWQGRLYKKCK